MAPVIHEWTYEAMAYDLLGLESDVFRYDVETQAGQATCLLKLVCRRVCHRTRCTPCLGNLADMQITRLHLPRSRLGLRCQLQLLHFLFNASLCLAGKVEMQGTLAGCLPNNMHSA